ncbi:MAG: protein kinase domain-containing protein [Gemmataceae bacterium]
MSRSAFSNSPKDDKAPLPSSAADPPGLATTPDLGRTETALGPTRAYGTLPTPELPEDDPFATRPAVETPTEPPVELAGYEILGKLGRGGMGVVYQARHIQSQRLVAIKMLREGIQTGTDLAERFRREADVLASLKHPNIVDFVEVGRQGACAYFVMELVTGGSLARKLAGQPQPPRDAAELVETLARAIHASHQAGIVHRDLKPSNVLLTAEGKLKVSDFGLAKRLDSDIRQTSTGAILGTPGYMAPEQASGRTRAIGPATDIYALGVILYETLTGRVPFQAPTLLETLELVRSQDAVPPRHIRPDVPRDLETICLKCLHKDPARRYATAADLADDLRRYLEDRPITARKVGLRERLVKWRRRHPVTSALAGSAAALLLLAAAFGLWHWNAHYRVRVEYFANMVKRRGVPEGIGPLTAAEVKPRHLSYQFFRRGGVVEEVRTVNGYGRPAVRTGSIAALVRESDPTEKLEFRYVYKRNQEGQLLEEEAQDRHGNVLWVLHFTAPDRAYYADKQGFPLARTGSGATYLGFVWSEAGFPLEINYLDRNGKRHTNDEGVFGVQSEYDSRGLITKYSYIDANNRPAFNKKQLIAGFSAETDEQGNRMEGRYFDAAGRPLLNKEGIASWTAQFDKWGNNTQVSYFGTNALPALSKAGYASIVSKYDENGNPTQADYLDTEGRPVLSKENVASGIWKFDSEGNRIEGSFYALDGRPVLCKNGYFRWQAEYDDRGNLVSTVFSGVDGEAVLHKEGYGGWVKRFDDRGNNIELAYTGTDGRPTVSREGFHKLVRQFNDFGYIVRAEYFGTDGSPTLCDKGYALWTATFDERGKQTEVSYFGTDGKPVLSKEGFARVAYKYDDRGNNIDIAYFDSEGRPVLTKDGFARKTIKYDDRGNILEGTYIGADGRLIANPNYETDKQASKTGGKRRLDSSEEDNPGPAGWDKDGIAKWKVVYDDHNNRIEMAYFGTDGLPAPDKDGCAKIVWKYDDRGNQIEEAYFGVDGRPAPDREGNAKFVRQFDERGYQIEETYFGADGRPIPDKEGCAKSTWKYDERGNQLEETYFGLDGQPAPDKEGCAKLVSKFDEHDNLVEQAYLGADGEPAADKEGFTKRTWKYDARGHEIEEAYFGLGGRPAANKEGHAKVLWKYDQRDNKIEEAYFDVKGQPAPGKFGIARVVSTFDDRGRETERSFFGVDGKPVLNMFAAARVVSQFDERGNETRRTYFNLDGRPTLSTLGYAALAMKWDDRGNQIETAFFGPDMRPILNKEGCARLVKKFDVYGNIAETAYFGVEGGPCLNKYGVFRSVARFDESGNQVDQSFFGTDGKPLPTRVTVISRLPSGSQDDAKLQQGDILEDFNGQPIKYAFQFEKLIKQESLNEPARPLRVIRKAKPVRLQVVPAELNIELRDVANSSK